MRNFGDPYRGGMAFGSLRVLGHTRFPEEKYVREVHFETMNALLLKEYMKLEVVEMPIPGIGPDDVLVRVKACGICGSVRRGRDIG